jgi:hypothetical protein
MPTSRVDRSVLDTVYTYLIYSFVPNSNREVCVIGYGYLTGCRWMIRSWPMLGATLLPPNFGSLFVLLEFSMPFSGLLVPAAIDAPIATHSSDVGFQNNFEFGNLSMVNYL